MAGARSLHTELYGFTTELIGRACLSPAACGEQSPPSLLPAPVSGGEHEWSSKKVFPKRPGRLERWPWVELKRGRTCKRIRRREERQGRRQATCKLPGTRKGWGGCRHAARGRGEDYQKAETCTKVPSRCRERAGEPSQGAGRWFRVGGGKQEAWRGLGVAPAPTAAALTSSRKPECGSLSASPRLPQLPGSLQPPAAARDPAFVPAQAGSSPPPPSAHRPSGPAIGHTRSLA